MKHHRGFAALSAFLRASLAAVLAASVATALPLPLLAMESPAPAAGEAVEEITVTGQRSLAVLRLQVEQAQHQVHLLFNDLNTDDAFDIVCKVDERLFSKIKEETCMPLYAWDARAKEAKNFIDKVRGTPTAEGRSANVEIDGYERVLEEQMVEAMQRSPELFDAMVKHAQLMEKLQEQRAAYFDGGEDE